MTAPKKTPTDLLHFVAAIDKRQQLLGYVCELQPLATVRIYGHGHPTRCPFCQQENPVSTSLSMEKNKEKA